MFCQCVKHLCHCTLMSRKQEDTCIPNRRFDEQSFIIKASCDVGQHLFHTQLWNGFRQYRLDMVMYECLKRVGLGVINEGYVVNCLNSQTSNRSKIPSVTFAVFQRKNVGKRFTNCVHLWSTKTERILREVLLSGSANGDSVGLFFCRNLYFTIASFILELTLQLNTCTRRFIRNGDRTIPEGNFSGRLQVNHFMSVVIAHWCLHIWYRTRLLWSCMKVRRFGWKCVE